MLRWPALTNSSTNFGSTGGLRREGTQCLAGIMTNPKGESPKCRPGCLFNLTADPSELNDLINQTSFNSLVTELKAKLQAAGKAAPPQNSYFGQAQLQESLDRVCAIEAQTGFLEPSDWQL